MLTVFVEGKLDHKIVHAILSKISAPNRDFEIVVVNGSLDPRRSIRKAALQLDHRGNSIAVYDQESGTIADQPDNVDFYSDGIEWCPAIPVTEAWLFADEDALLRSIPENLHDVVTRLPSPESIPYPKVLRNYLLRGENSIDRIFALYNLERAAARSPSLGNFLRASQKRMNLVETFESATVMSRQIDREIIRTLISEVYPGSTTIFRSSSGEAFSANQMLQEISGSTPIGLEYSTAILRTARDLLQRQAQKSKKR